MVVVMVLHPPFTVALTKVSLTTDVKSALTNTLFTFYRMEIDRLGHEVRPFPPFGARALVLASNELEFQFSTHRDRTKYTT